MHVQKCILGFAVLGLMVPAVHGQAAGSSAAMLGGLHWREVGPMRGGRTYGVSGNAAEPDTFYMGSVGGGVWKTENAGRTWLPISDTGIPIGSIGAIAVAPSDPKIVYVGTGEPDIRSQHSYGIGMFKSTDAGKTWKPIGLEATRQIGRIVVDPRDPNKVYVAALGQCVSRERGAWRVSLDRRRRALDQGAGEQGGSGERGRGRPGDRSAAAGDALCLAMGDAASTVVGLCALKHAGWRPVQVDRQRRALDQAGGRSAGGSLCREDRDRGGAQQSQAAVGGGR